MKYIVPNIAKRFQMGRENAENGKHLIGSLGNT